MKTYETESRRAVCEFLRENSDKQYTAEEVASVLSEHAGKSTVYRLLSRLCEEGAIRRLSREGERSAVYQAIPDDKCLGHLHMKCVECGRLVHLNEAETRRIAGVAVGRGFALDTKRTMVYGLCGDCAGGGV